MAESTPQSPNGSEIIDATQNAVIQAVDNVSEMIEETTKISEFQPHPHEVFYQSAEFWVAISFLLVVVLLAKPVAQMVQKMLMKRRENIVDKINQAEKLRDDAQVLLAQYERQFLHAKEEADEILKNSKREIDLIKNEELNKLDAELKARQKEVEAGIAAAIEKAKNEINQAVSSKAVEIARKYIESTNDSKKKSDNIDKSLNHIFKMLS